MRLPAPAAFPWRWMKFNLVGAAGVPVQLSFLFLLKSIAGLHYLPATALAVEAAVLHNFAWHQRFTWADRPHGGGWMPVVRRLLRFNLTTGALSILSNLVLMRLLVATMGLHYLPANLLAIAVISLANYLLADHFVFTRATTHGAAHHMEPRPAEAVKVSISGESPQAVPLPAPEPTSPSFE